MKTTLVLLTFLASLSAFASSESRPTAECLGDTSAFERNVLAAIRAAKYKDVTADDIKQTNAGSPDAYHDPEFDVTVAGGKVVHVTCDDSGDHDCACSLAGS